MKILLQAAVVIGWTCAGLFPSIAAPNCNGFFANSDGSWSPTHVFVIGGAASPTEINPTDRLRAGAPGFNGRLARYLDTHCRAGGAALRIPKMP